MKKSIFDRLLSVALAVLIALGTSSLLMLVGASGSTGDRDESLIPGNTVVWVDDYETDGEEGAVIPPQRIATTGPLWPERISEDNPNFPSFIRGTKGYFSLDGSASFVYDISEVNAVEVVAALVNTFNTNCVKLYLSEDKVNWGVANEVETLVHKENLDTQPASPILDETLPNSRKWNIVNYLVKNIPSQMNYLKIEWTGVDPAYGVNIRKVSGLNYTETAKVYDGWQDVFEPGIIKTWCSSKNIYPDTVTNVPYLQSDRATGMGAYILGATSGYAVYNVQSLAEIKFVSSFVAGIPQENMKIYYSRVHNVGGADGFDIGEASGWEIVPDYQVETRAANNDGSVLINPDVSARKWDTMDFTLNNIPDDVKWVKFAWTADPGYFVRVHAIKTIKATEKTFEDKGDVLWTDDCNDYTELSAYSANVIYAEQTAADDPNFIANRRGEYSIRAFAEDAGNPSWMAYALEDARTVVFDTALCNDADERYEFLPDFYTTTDEIITAQSVWTKIDITKKYLYKENLDSKIHMPVYALYMNERKFTNAKLLIENIPQNTKHIKLAFKPTAGIPVYGVKVYNVTGYGEAKVPATVNIKFYEENKTQDLATPETLNGFVGDAYVSAYATARKQIAGYTFKKVIGAESGAYTADPITITYVYTKNAAATGRLLINFVEEGKTEALATQEIITGEQGTAYTSPYKDSKKAIEGYQFKSVTGNETGNFTDGDISITYVYTKKQTQPEYIKLWEDELENESRIIAKSENLVYREQTPSDGINFSPDRAGKWAIAKFGDGGPENSWVVYDITGVDRFESEASIVNGSGNPVYPAHQKFYVSSDKTNWKPLAVDADLREYAGKWSDVTYTADKIPSGTKYLKIVLYVPEQLPPYASRFCGITAYKLKTTDDPETPPVRIYKEVWKDELKDESKIIGKSENLVYLDDTARDNPNFSDARLGQKAFMRFGEPGEEGSYIMYSINGIDKFVTEASILNSVGNPGYPIHQKLYVSKDKTNWTLLTVDALLREYEGKWTDVTYTAENIPTGSKYLKVVLYLPDSVPSYGTRFYGITAYKLVAGDNGDPNTDTSESVPFYIVTFITCVSGLGVICLKKKRARTAK